MECDLIDVAVHSTASSMTSFFFNRTTFRPAENGLRRRASAPLATPIHKSSALGGQVPERMLNNLVSSLSLSRKPLQLGAPRVALGEVSVRPGLVAQSRLVEPVRGAAFVPRLGVKPRVLSAPGGTRPSGSDGPRRLIAPPPCPQVEHRAREVCPGRGRGPARGID